jgi:cyanate permease
VVGGMIIDATGNWNLPFVVSMILMLLGTGLAFVMRPDRQLKEAPEPAAASGAARFG